MRCPIDDTDLVMTDRQGIEVDYCPKCRGVWLDRGELDKIIDRSSAVQAPHRDDEYDRPSHSEDQGRSRDYDEDDNYRGSEERSDEHHRGKKRKKEGFLGDLFDF